MDKNRIVGSGKQIKEIIEESIGKLIGNSKLQADGKTHQTEGKAQNIVGSIKDSLKS